MWLEPHRFLLRENELHLLFGVYGGLCRLDELPNVGDLLSCLAAEEKSGDQQHGAGGCTGDSDETPPAGRRRRTHLRFRDPFRETAVGRFGVEEGVGQVSLAPCVVGVEVAAAVFLRRAEPVEEFGLLGIGETFAVEVACDQSVDMSVLCVHLSYSRIGGPNPYLPDRKKIPIRPKREAAPAATSRRIGKTSLVWKAYGDVPILYFFRRP